jgi:tetratricopeptide (TPR) repeat protein
MSPKMSSLLWVSFFIVCISHAQTPRIDSLRTVLKTVTDPVKTATISSDISEAFYDMQLYPDSTYFYAERAYEIASKSGLKRQEGRALANQGMVFGKLDKYDEALAYFQKAKVLFEDLGDPLNLSVLNSSIANVYYDKKNYESAVAYFEKAIALSIQEKDSVGMVIDYMNVGECEYKMGRLDASKTHLEYALSLMEELKMSFSAGHIYYGNTLLALSQVDRALEEGRLGLILAQKEQDIKNISEASELLFKVNVAQDDYKSAIVHYERFIVYKDSLNAAKELNNVEKLKLNFDLNQKEKELVYVSQKAKYLNVIYVLVALGVVLLVFLISRQQKVSRMTKDIHDIQTSLVQREMNEREVRKKGQRETTNFTLTRAQDAEIKE